MNKKVLKSLYSDIVSKDNIRPVFTGVYFDEDVCVATDSTVLVVYKETAPNYIGKIVGIDGKIIDGKFPAYNAVIPKGDGEVLDIDFSQLHRALKWWCGQPKRNPHDSIMLKGIALCIKKLRNIFNVIKTAGEFSSIKFSIFGETSAVRIDTDSTTSILMPMNPETGVDLEREGDSLVVVSYSNLINTFAIESSRPKEKKEEMSWL